MVNVPVRAVLSDAALTALETSDSFPALRQASQHSIGERLERARRELWRAYERGALTEDELTRTLERLEFDPLSPGLL